MFVGLVGFVLERGQRVNLVTEKNSKVISAESPSPRTWLSREELEGVLSFVLNDLCANDRSMEPPSKSAIRGALLEPRTLLPLSQDELERVLTEMAGDLCRPQFGCNRANPLS